MTKSLCMKTWARQCWDPTRQSFPAAPKGFWVVLYASWLAIAAVRLVYGWLSYEQWEKWGKIIREWPVSFSRQSLKETKNWRLLFFVKRHLPCIEIFMYCLIRRWYNQHSSIFASILVSLIITSTADELICRTFKLRIYSFNILIKITSNYFGLKLLTDAWFCQKSS